jgi:hypothetical protein
MAVARRCRPLHWRSLGTALAQGVGFNNEGSRLSSQSVMSDLRISKERRAATLTLSDGRQIAGSFFVAGSSVSHAGPERVKDILNSPNAFFPFEISDGVGQHTGIFNREQVIVVELATDEANSEAAYDVATRRSVEMLLSNGRRLKGLVRVYCPRGSDRLSDYTRAEEMFRYLETPDALLAINFRHVLELSEVEAA